MEVVVDSSDFGRDGADNMDLLSCQVKTTVAWHQLKLVSKLGSGFSKQ